MKRILASLAFASLLLAPTALPQEEPPGPLSVDAIVIDGVAKVKWVPPVMAPGDLGGAAFRVYGYRDGEEPTRLHTTNGLTVYAEVTGGYDTYAVALVVNGVESLHVKVMLCANVELLPPPPSIEFTC